jgi:hypothetical protein
MRLRWGETLERVIWGSWAALGLLARPRDASLLDRAGGMAMGHDRARAFEPNMKKTIFFRSNFI